MVSVIPGMRAAKVHTDKLITTRAGLVSGSRISSATVATMINPIQ